MKKKYKHRKVENSRLCCLGHARKWLKSVTVTLKAEWQTNNAVLCLYTQVYDQEFFNPNPLLTEKKP